MLHPSRLALLTLATLALVAARSPAAGAAVVEVVPFIGVLQPLENEIEDGTVPIIFQLSSGNAYGARAAWWFNDRLALEAAVTTAGVNLHLTGNAAITSPASWLATDARARVRLLGGDAPMALDLVGGVGYTTLRYGLNSIFEASGLNSESQVGWILGLGATVGVGNGLGLRMEFEDHIHEQNFEADPTVVTIDVGDRTQHELVFSLGLVVPVSGK